jgi:hypothetical protein
MDISISSNALTNEGAIRMVQADINNDAHARIFERYCIGVGMTPRMVTNLDTGENYQNGEQAAKILGVTRQDVNNCIRGRQATVKGVHLAQAAEFRRALMGQFRDICEANGTDYLAVIDEFRRM